LATPPSVSRLAASPQVSVSWGELLDKITILEIKQERIADSAARANVTRELRQLWRVGAGALGREGMAELFSALKTVNEALWEVEDSIRQQEALGQFESEFIRLARAVYQQNDRRAALKREINCLLQSELVEEKSYWTMPPASVAASIQAAEPLALATTAGT
jgi:hypothetical protein